MEFQVWPCLASAWTVCLQASKRLNLEDCEVPELRSVKPRECSHLVGQYVQFQRGIVRVGYLREPTDMPASEAAKAIEQIVKEDLGITDLRERVGRHWGSNSDGIDDEIVNYFMPLLYRVRGTWVDQGAKRQAFAVTFEEPVIAKVIRVRRKKLGKHIPASETHTWEYESYEPPSFHETQTLSLLETNERVQWLGGAGHPRVTNMFIHPDDVLCVRDDITRYMEA